MTDAEFDPSARHAQYTAALAQRTDPISRRRFLELMGASLALAGAPPPARRRGTRSSLTSGRPKKSCPASRCTSPPPTS
jgi:hypothetical protein